MAFPSDIEIEGLCPHCGERQNVHYDGRGLLCGSCQRPLLPHATDRLKQEGRLDQCPLCGCQHLFRQKDFNRLIGIATVVVGSVLAFFTYGLSLIGVALIDWWIYRSVGDVGCCYECKATFRNPTSVAQLEPFQLQLHDYYRSVSKG